MPYIASSFLGICYVTVQCRDQHHHAYCLGCVGCLPFVLLFQIHGVIVNF